MAIKMSNPIQVALRNKNAWTITQPNYGLLTIKQAQFALVKDVVLKNTVYDGVNLFECELGVIADSKAEGGVNLIYGQLRSTFGRGYQATYFKCTRRNSQVVYFINLDCKGGSIGVHYSTNNVSDSSLAVVNNCHFYNQSQDALHFESCRKIFIYQSTVGADNFENYRANVHISNSCEIASIKNSQFKNGRIDFRNASSLKFGLVEGCQFESYAQNENDSTTLRFFVHNATHVKSSSFNGRTREEQVLAKYIANSSFINFNNAVNAAGLVYKCQFKNGNIPIINPTKPLIGACEFNDIKSSIKLNKSSNEKIFTRCNCRKLII
jgi:hypothetical protein